jgi:hypothetical protein
MLELEQYGNLPLKCSEEERRLEEEKVREIPSLSIFCLSVYKKNCFTLLHWKIDGLLLNQKLYWKI